MIFCTKCTISLFLDILGNSVNTVQIVQNSDSCALIQFGIVLILNFYTFVRFGAFIIVQLYHFANMIFVQSQPSKINCTLTQCTKTVGLYA